MSESKIKPTAKATNTPAPKGLSVKQRIRFLASIAGVQVVDPASKGPFILVYLGEPIDE